MECKQKPEINYPCQWSYKIIGHDKELVRDAAESVFEGKQYLLTYSKSSRTGKYHSWAAELVVDSEVMRNSLFQALQKHPDVKMVF